MIVNLKLHKQSGNKNDNTLDINRQDQQKAQNDDGEGPILENLGLTALRTRLCPQYTHISFLAFK